MKHVMRTIIKAQSSSKDINKKKIITVGCNNRSDFKCIEKHRVISIDNDFSPLTRSSTMSKK